MPGPGSTFVPIPPARAADIFQSTLPSTLHASTRISGNGSPEGAVPGVPGQVYVDLATADPSDLYMKITGSQELGWRLIGKWSQSSGGGGSATGTLFFGIGDPTGVITPTVSAAYYVDIAGGPSFTWNGTNWF